MLLTYETQLYLPDDVSLYADGLHDEILGHTFRLNTVGLEAISGLVNGDTLGVVSDRLASRFKVEPERVAGDIRRLLGQLNERALVNLYVPRASRWATASANLPGTLKRVAFNVLSLDWPPPALLRRRGSARNLLWGTARFTLLMLGLGVFLSMILLFAVSSTPQVDASKPGVLLACFVPLAALTALALSVYAHELGHLLALRRVLPQAQVAVVSRGLTTSIAHARLGVGGAAVALAGPLLALTFGGGVAAVAATLGAPDFYVGTFLALGAAHLYSLVPWSHDGRMLWRRRARAVIT